MIKCVIKARMYATSVVVRLRDNQYLTSSCMEFSSSPYALITV